MLPVGAKSTPDPGTRARLGRYEILGQLGAGGMAEVLLGRLLGPSGFERLVVIKRILPHLARRQKFVDMFLDEARVVARIRHPNVVHVHELTHEDGELFLVLEYLEGESAAGLLRRLAVRGERLPLAVAAHIVALACAGLHAAHELVGPDGQRQDVVHRDVSPQNVFVTYGGMVKVLDFGVALARDRIVETDAGELKGKFAYMAPEQWRGEVIDRRADIFALGVVLWELTTGHRLFQRPNQVASLKAICEEPVLPPSALVVGYPPALEAVCLRALAKDREDRHPTAADMRRELLAAVRHLGDEPEAELAEIMARVFPDRIAEKTRLVQLAERGGAVRDVPPADVDDTVELPVAPAAPTTVTPVVMIAREPPASARALSVGGESGPSASVDVLAPLPAPPPRGRRVVAVVGGAALVALLLAAGLLVRRASVHPAEPVPSSEAALAPVAAVDASPAVTSTAVTSAATAASDLTPAAAASSSPIAAATTSRPPRGPRKTPSRPAPTASATGFAVIPF